MNLRIAKVHNLNKLIKVNLSVFCLLLLYQKKFDISGVLQRMLRVMQQPTATWKFIAQKKLQNQSQAKDKKLVTVEKTVKDVIIKNQRFIQTIPGPLPELALIRHSSQMRWSRLWLVKVKNVLWSPWLQASQLQTFCGSRTARSWRHQSGTTLSSIALLEFVHWRYSRLEL